MKKFVSLLLAVVSTTFLIAGATQAAEKFDGLAKSASTGNSGSYLDGPTSACVELPDGT
jgi:outer membrane murein-binding lipoprotein Lpp